MKTCIVKFREEIYRETSLLASNVTKLLDDVMENYEKEFRPGFESQYH